VGAPDPRFLDELAVRALPADETVEVDGWLLRSSPSLPFRRANAALPAPSHHGGPEPPRLPDLDGIEAFYRDRDRSPLVALPTGTAAAIDDALATRRWVLEAPVAVLWAWAGDVGRRTDPPHQADPATDPTTDLTFDDDIVSLRAASWLDDRGRDRLEAYRRVLAHHGPAGRSLVARRHDGTAVGVSHAVTVEGWTAVFGMAVDPAHRRRGVARSLVRAIAVTPGHTGLWLQVELDNAPARRLYGSAGFTESHRTHYRRAPTEPRRPHGERPPR